ncbi:MAG TPA: phospholipid carrier-dependent glycosyltransferase [Prolixibacteraceae bacterium]|nr:phospholipid carrier-dependent glycosyltransferase [Prolixibacteraceae bacterium]
MATNPQMFRNILPLFFVSSILLFWGLGKLDVNIMEARNFVTAREMVQNNEYLLTTLNGQPRYEKPPLPSWLTAASGVVFGFDSLFAMRLPVVLITMLLVFAFYLFSVQLKLTSKHALQNGLILVTSFYVFFAGRDNQWDMYTHSFMMVSVLFLWKLFTSATNQWKNSLLSGLFLGFSILSKGPVSAYAMLLPFLISYGIVYRVPFRKKWAYFAAMLFSGMIIGASWYIYVRLKDPASFQTIASREAANWTSYEVKPFYYYWDFFVQSGLWAIPSLVALTYPYMKTRVRDLKSYQFALFWTLLGIVFLSAIPEKKVRYLVPVLIPLALTTGFYIEYLIQNFKFSLLNWEKALASTFSSAIALVGFAFPFAIAFVLKERLASHYFLFIISSVATIAGAVIIIRGLISGKFNSAFYAMISIFVAIVIATLPLYKEVVSNPNYASAKKALSIEQDYHIKTYSLSAVAPEIIWDFGKPIPVINSLGNQASVPDELKFGLLVDVKDSSVVKGFSPKYIAKKLYRINLHYNKNLKERLVKDYYLISQKE